MEAPMQDSWLLSWLLSWFFLAPLSWLLLATPGSSSGAPWLLSPGSPWRPQAPLSWLLAPLLASLLAHRYCWLLLPPSWLDPGSSWLFSPGSSHTHTAKAPWSSSWPVRPSAILLRFRVQSQFPRGTGFAHEREAAIAQRSRNIKIGSKRDPEERLYLHRKNV